MNIRSRKLVGLFLLVGGIAAYCLIVADLLSRIDRLPIALEVLIYVIAGVVWIFPAYSLIRWMETGTWWVRRDR